MSEFSDLVDTGPDVAIAKRIRDAADTLCVALNDADKIIGLKTGIRIQRNEYNGKWERAFTIERVLQL